MTSGSLVVSVGYVVISGSTVVDGSAGTSVVELSGSIVGVDISGSSVVGPLVIGGSVAGSEVVDWGSGSVELISGSTGAVVVVGGPPSSRHGFFHWYGWTHI